jgi:hypothetical protein
MNQSALYFIGDTQWGIHLETPHHVGNSLLLRYPDVDFQFSYNNSLQNTLIHLNAHDAKDIIGKKAQHIILSAGWVDIDFLNDTNLDYTPLLSLIDHLTSIKGLELYICNQAIDSYSSNDKKEAAKSYNEILMDHTLENLHIIDYNDAFSQFHQSESRIERTPHSLHFSNAQLTQLGSHLLAEAFLIKIEKNATFLERQKDNS